MVYATIDISPEIYEELAKQGYVLDELLLKRSNGSNKAGFSIEYARKLKVGKLPPGVLEKTQKQRSVSQEETRKQIS